MLKSPWQHVDNTASRQFNIVVCMFSWQPRTCRVLPTLDAGRGRDVEIQLHTHGRQKYSCRQIALNKMPSIVMPSKRIFTFTSDRLIFFPLYVWDLGMCTAWLIRQVLLSINV